MYTHGAARQRLGVPAATQCWPGGGLPTPLATSTVQPSSLWLPWGHGGFVSPWRGRGGRIPGAQRVRTLSREMVGQQRTTDCLLTGCQWCPRGPRARKKSSSPGPKLTSSKEERKEQDPYPPECCKPEVGNTLLAASAGGDQRWEDSCFQAECLVLRCGFGRQGLHGLTVSSQPPWASMVHAGSPWARPKPLVRRAISRVSAFVSFLLHWARIPYPSSCPS